MTNATTINLKGVVGEKTKLSEKVFGTQASPSLLAQAVRVFLSNQRKANAKTKTRGEINKTTAKMYRQKGTGRARHGSYSAPIFVGGGVALGPTGTQSYKLKLTKKQNKLALGGALAEKANAQKITVIEGTGKFSGKTKDAALVIFKATEGRGKTLVIVGEKEEAAKRMFANLDKVTVSQTKQLNSFLIMRNQNLILTKTALDEITK